MKKVITIITLLLGMESALAQTTMWQSPHIGYSSTDMLSVDKIEFTKSTTLMHVIASGRGRTTFWIAPTSCLKADGKRYALKKVPKIGVNKMFAIPDSGKVHFTMQFEPLPRYEMRGCIERCDLFSLYARFCPFSAPADEEMHFF